MRLGVRITNPLLSLLVSPSAWANSWASGSKHINNHTKRRRCGICDAGGAETKDLNRHMWTNHPDEARMLGVPKDEDRCSMCGYTGRSDNVKRHKDKKGHWACLS
jgi:hypothetical protein